MIARCAAGLLIVGSAIAAAADGALPVIHTSSPTLSVEDGPRTLPNYWTVSPQTPLDVYYARPSAGDRRVVFRGTSDALAVTLHPGDRYDFEVVLDGRRCCHTRISTLRELPHVEGNVPLAIVPFVIGPDDKIHVVGRFNDSRPLDLEVDIGADTAMLYPSAISRGAALSVDGQADNAGTGGTVRRDFSNDNRLAIGNLRWEHVPVVINAAQNDRADGLIGFVQFDNKVVEFDFDEGVMRIGDELPARVQSWTRLPLTFPHQLPAIAARIDDGRAPFDVRLVLDTGSNLSLFVNHAASRDAGWSGSLTHLGRSEMHGTGIGTVSNDVLLLPALHLGREEWHDVPMHVSTGDDAPEASGHLGMDVLRRSNLVLDLRNDIVYLAPNRLRDAPWRTNYRTGRAWRIATGIALFAALAAAWWWRRRRAS